MKLNPWAELAQIDRTVYAEVHFSFSFAVIGNETNQRGLSMYKHLVKIAMERQ